MFLLALKMPTRQAFHNAVDACHEVFLFKENDVGLGNKYLTTAYWL
jgi:hypothetical protein